MLGLNVVLSADWSEATILPPLLFTTAPGNTAATKISLPKKNQQTFFQVTPEVRYD